MDGKSLYGHTNHQAVEVLRRSGTRVHLRLARYLRGAKYHQLQQLVANADVTAPPQPAPEPSLQPTSDRIPGSTLIQLQGSPTQPLSGSRIPAPDAGSEANLPTSPATGLSLHQASPAVDRQNGDLAAQLRRLQEKWSQKLGPDFLIIVSDLPTPAACP